MLNYYGNTLFSGLHNVLIISINVSWKKKSNLVQFTSGIMDSSRQLQYFNIIIIHEFIK